MEQRARLVQFLCLTCGLQGMKECVAQEEKTETLFCSRCNSKVIFTTKFFDGPVSFNFTSAR